MVLIQDGQQSGVSFLYPLGFGGGPQPCNVIRWDTYRKWLRLRVGLNVVFIVFGLLLLDHRLYTDTLYNIYAALVLAFTAVKAWLFLPRVTMTVTQSTSVKLLPMAGFDFSGTFIVLGIMLLVFSAQADQQHTGAQFVFLAIAFMCLGALPLVTLGKFLSRR